MISRYKNFRIESVLFALLTIFPGCSSGLPTKSAQIDCTDKKTVELTLEIADSSDEREKGLMFRKSLEPNSGMLFIFENQSKQAFWMKNTFIPLDMIFLDSSRTVVGIVEKAAPLTESPRAVDAESQYVIELFGGEAKKLGIEKGCKLTF